MWFVIQLTDETGATFVYPIDPEDAADQNAAMEIGQQVNMQHPGHEVRVLRACPGYAGQVEYAPFAAYPSLN